VRLARTNGSMTVETHRNSSSSSSNWVASS
jgi:hypothetical protein